MSTGPLANIKVLGVPLLVNKEGDEDPFVTMPTSGLLGLTHVRLYESTWDTKLAKHPEIGELGPEGLKNAICEPTGVYKSTTRPHDSVVFVNENATSTGHNLVVPVRVLGGGYGRITTAYVTPTGYRGEKIGPEKND